MSSLGSLNVTVVLVNFTVASTLECFLIVSETSSLVSSVTADYLDLLCPKLSIKLVAGIVMNSKLVRRSSVFPNF